MAPLSPLAYPQVVRKLLNAGFKPVSQRGGHVQFSKEDLERSLTVVMPRHHELTVGTLRNILRQAELTRREFADL